MPPTLAIIGSILVLAALAAQVLPPGTFQREAKTFKVGDLATVEHVVAEGETRESIAASVGDSATLLHPWRDAAGLEVGTLRVGETVLVPVYRTRTRTVVVPGSYRRVERRSYDGAFARAADVIGQVVMAPIRGFQAKAEVIAFILLLGGAFGMVLATGAVDAALRTAVARLSGSRAEWAVIPVLMVLFSLGGAIFGMSEEVIPFVLVTIPLAIRMGYDAITGLCMSFVAAGLGFAGAFFNPFTVQIAQGIAELQPLSGMGFRIGLWATVTTLGIGYTLWWATRVKRRPELSPTFENDRKLIHKFEAADGTAHELGMREWLVLGIFAGGMGLLVWGVTQRGWYMEELSGVFVGMGLLAAIAGRLSMEKAATAFVRGASDLAGAALIVAVSAGIVRVMEDGQVLDTILDAVAAGLNQTHSVVAACLMFLFQTVLNFFVPSGSGQAAMTMPIMAPLSDLVGVSRQTAVLAFQMGDGFGNMIIPTSAVTMSVLGIAEIPWERWAKWLLPLELLLLVVGCAALALAIAVGYA
jgi:uncharacterized ion transporter superfamily protein YfcC